MGFHFDIRIQFSTLNVIICLTSHQNVGTQTISADFFDTEDEEKYFMEGLRNETELCLADSPVKSKDPVCALKLENQTRTYRKFDNICWYLLANYLTDTGFVIIAEDAELCERRNRQTKLPRKIKARYQASTSYNALRRVNIKKNTTKKKAVLRGKSITTKKVTAKPKATTKKAAKTTAKLKETTKTASTITTKKYSIPFKKLAENTTKETTKKFDGKTKKPAVTVTVKRNKTDHSHMCPLYCTDQYDPVCIEHKPRTKNAQLISFINHCHMDLYICSLTTPIPSKHSTLHVTTCVSVKSANFYIGSNTMSTFNRIGWLGKDSFRTILRRMMDI